jgi:hypothetical protein
VVKRKFFFKFNILFHSLNSFAVSVNQQKLVNIEPINRKSNGRKVNIE